jgi:hypothetical protein
MSTLQVEIVFDLNANGAGDFFTLDDAAKGKLDNTDYKLAGEVLTDVSDTVRSATINRGRNKQLERFTAGTASVTLDNRNRVYDPTNAAGPHYNQILPQKEIVIKDAGVVIYTGLISDWNFGYAIGGDSTAEVVCVDGTSLLVDPFITAATQSAETTGARIVKVLDDIEWSTAKRDISAGKQLLGTDVIAAETKGLEYLNKISTSEPGAFFIGKTGSVVFRDRDDLQSATNTVFSASQIPFSNIAVEFGIEEMMNSVVVKWTGGTVALTDAASIEKYGVFETTYQTLLPSAANATSFAQFQLGIYAEPTYRVDQITTLLHALPLVKQQEVLNLELGDVVLVKWTPNNIGAEITQAVSIDKIEFAGVTKEERAVTFSMSETAASFILDNATFGILSTGILGY